MKKIIVLLLIFTHLFSGVGFSMNVHYCGNHKSCSFFGVEVGTKCGCNHQGHHHRKDCCKDKKVEVKAQKKVNVRSEIFTLKDFTLFDLLPVYTSSSKEYFSQANIETKISGHPPDFSPPLYILHSDFRI